MVDSYLPLLEAVVSALKADAAVGNVIGDRIYTEIPQNETFPYAYVSIDSDDFSGKTFTGMEHTVEVQVFSRETTPTETANARSAIYNVLNRAEDTLTLATGHFASMNFITGLIRKEDDGVTWQGVIQFSAVIT